MARGRPPGSGNAKRAAKAKSNDDYQNMTTKQFQMLKSYGTFVITDPETGEAAYKFKRGDIAAILPYGRNPGEEMEMSDYWVGVIRDIRAEVDDDDNNVVLALLNWYYSGGDVKGIIKSFDETAIGKFERIKAEHKDFVGSESFESVLTLVEFNECDPDQIYIPRDQFYCRYSLERNARIIKPKPGSSGCTCLKPYDPNDITPSHVMHFCPRPSCRRAYHQDCLLEAKSFEVLPPEPKAPAKASASQRKPAPSQKRRSARMHTSPIKKPLPSRSKTKVTFEEPDDDIVNSNTPVIPFTSTSTRPNRLLACSPDTDDPVDLESLVPLQLVTITSTGSQRGTIKEDENDSDTIIIAQPPRKKRRGPGRPPASSRKVSSSSQPLAQIQEPRSLAAVLSEIPGDLLDIAQQPMVRGGAFVRGGVSGNIGFVTRARRLVYKILEGERTVADLLERVDLPIDGIPGVSRDRSPSASISANGAGGSGRAGTTMNMAKWEAEVFGPEKERGWDVDEENAIVKIAGSRKTLPALVCPNCKSAI